MSFLLVDTYPCNTTLAPYVYLLKKWSRAHINSIYRGSDAAALLHKYGHHDQKEIHEKYPAISNPPGRSSHELRSDGSAYPGPVGAKLQWWEQGIDVNDEDVAAIKLHAQRHGWAIRQPYTRGVEFHHVSFATRPVARGWDRIQVIRLRVTLPRH